MRFFVVFLFVFLQCPLIFSQNITVSDFKKIIELPSLESAKKFIESKGFKYYKVADSKVENVTTTSWSYGYNAKTDEATAWMSVSCDGNKPIRTYYEVFDFSLSMPLVNDVQKNNYTFEHIDSDDEEFTSRYAITDYYLFQYQKKETKKGYKFECIKKFSKADPLNGTSIKYYPHGNVKYTVEVRNGKWNGASKNYNEQGVLVAEGMWKDDKKEGAFSFYDESGVLTSRERYAYDALKEATFYHTNGKERRTYQYLMDKRSGKSLAYDELGNLVEEAFYIADKLFGSFKQYVKGVESFSAFYSNDTLKGLYTKTLFNDRGERYAQERGTYKDGFQEGKILAIYDKTKDTLWCKHFVNSQPVGPWKFYSVDGALTKTILFNSGTESQEIRFENGKPVHNVQNNGLENKMWKFRYTYEQEGEKRELNFAVPFSEMYSGGELFDFFNTETQLYYAATVLDALHKNGKYSLENSTIRMEGSFNQDRPVGIWKRTFLATNASSETVFDENGKDLLERFTNKKGKPFSGSITYQDGDYLVKISVKKGLKEGVTTIKNTKDGSTKQWMYQAGNLVQP
jgi:antitoxin component YwqK of YwqJK toxin-antitoxin module